MKGSIFLSLYLLAAIGFSQDVGGKTLVSQSRSTTANIGKCDITIKYHSPSVNGRKIFGGIVPFDFVVDGKEYPWRAGSNQRTTIEFSHPVEVEGQKLDSGSYGFLVLVSEKEWTLIFSSGKSWGAFNYDKANDIIRVPVKTKNMPFQEWLSYEFINPKSESVDVQLRWEETAVTFNIQTDAFSNIISDIESKEQKDANDYQELAVRTLENNPNQKELALDYLEKSRLAFDTMSNEYYRQHYKFAYQMLKAELLESQGNRDQAKELKEKAWTTASGFNIYYYALRKYAVEEKKKEALDILKQGIKTHPDNFQTHFAFGEYYLKEKNQQKATEHFKKALDMTIEQKSRWENYARYLYLQNKLVLERN
ncbi:DUF2911 domain-containing protein [Ekhidna sp.]|uniref:DUF2911 domain-containing protein n=1 Tax=Ekhidna sp. TaxID=2608089 RepID=UPI0032ED855B